MLVVLSIAVVFAHLALVFLAWAAWGVWRQAERQSARMHALLSESQARLVFLSLARREEPGAQALAAQFGDQMRDRELHRNGIPYASASSLPVDPHEDQLG